MSNDEDVEDSSMDELLIPRAEHARKSASKRVIIGEVDESPLFTSRSAPRTDLKHRKDSLLRMATEQKVRCGYTGRSRLESKKMKV